MRDPLGPGTPAWNAFDNALEAWQQLTKHPKPRSRLPIAKRYNNCRQYMLLCVVKHGGNPAEWSQALNLQKLEETS